MYMYVCVNFLYVCVYLDSSRCYQNYSCSTVQVVCYDKEKETKKDKTEYTRL